VDHDTGGIPTGGSGEIITEAFRPGTEPGAVFDDRGGFSISGNRGASEGTADTADPFGEDLQYDPADAPDDVADESLSDIY
ncbi:MAG: hypothetical protein WA989_04690, partial [Henriciella sp.]|uniref:hypothetical protein n=1 Tax=Henriciella sp. TaxID=1968823 RepID=UPI003C766F18